MQRTRWNARGLFAAIVGALLMVMPLAPHVVAAQNGAGTRSTADERAHETDQADIQERGVGGLRSDTTGQSSYTDYSMGVDIPPGAGGSRSDMSGQPDYTDNHMGVDTPPGRARY